MALPIRLASVEMKPVRNWQISELSSFLRSLLGKELKGVGARVNTLALPLM